MTAVLVPVLLLAFGLTWFAFSALGSAAAQADQVSTARQEQEVRLATNAALDELAQSQAGVAIWNPLVLELRKPRLVRSSVILPIVHVACRTSF